MSNLLPIDAKKRLGRQIQARYVFVAASLILCAALFAALSLAPAYISVILARDGVQFPPSDVSQGVREDQEAAQRAQALVDALTPIVAATSTPTEVVVHALSLKPNGVRISTMSYSRGSILLNGTSNSREELNTYREALQNDGRFTSVSVPVAALVGAQEGRFTITLSGNF